MEKIKGYAGVVALVILAIMGLSGALKSGAHLAGSTSCGSITCLAGGLRLVSDLGGDFEVDVASLFTGTMGITGNTTITGTLGVTATTTLADTVRLTNPAICVDFFATSTATVSHLVASTTATIEGVDGVMMFAYGACAN